MRIRTSTFVAILTAISVSSTRDYVAANEEGDSMGLWGRIRAIAPCWVICDNHDVRFAVDINAVA
jgi:hypothetical protein